MFSTLTPQVLQLSKRCYECIFEFTHSKMNNGLLNIIGVGGGGTPEHNHS
jgi:hypothetical protein